MRKISDVDDFPFLAKDVKYYEAINNELCDLANNEASIKDAYIRAENGESNLYATWHGIYKTDMFFIDDLNKLGVAFSFEQSQHEHKIVWKCKNPQEKGTYVTVDIEFACGCTFDTDDGIYRLKKELLLCKGWDIATSYRGGYNGKYTIRVKKNTL